MKYAVIYSADYHFQVLQLLPTSNRDDVWDLANNLFADDEDVEHYDVVQFDSLKEANHWIIDQVKDSRTQYQPKPTLQS